MVCTWEDAYAFCEPPSASTWEDAYALMLMGGYAYALCEPPGRGSSRRDEAKPRRGAAREANVLHTCTTSEYSSVPSY